MPECRNAADKCQCHHTYKQYNDKMDDGQKTVKVCLKLYKSKKLNWKNADKKCSMEFSYLLFNYTENSAFKDYKKEGVDLVWIGIRKLFGFYTRLSNYPNLFKESNGERGMKWADNEPTYDCVALDISTGNLVTRPCSTQLAFICQNNGFPVYPVANTLACSEDWLLFYHADMEEDKSRKKINMKKCIRVFKRVNPYTEQACLNIGGTKVDDDSYYINLYSYLSRLKIKGFPKLSSNICNGKYIESIMGGPLKVIDSLVTCPDMLFICEQDFQSVSLTAKILPETVASITTKDANLTTFTCDVSFNTKIVHDTKEQLHFNWFKDGIPTTAGGNILQLNPVSMIHQGSYHCEIRIEGLQYTYLSSEVSYFYSDVSTYILTFHGNTRELSYKDFSKISFQNFRSYLNESMAAFSTSNLLSFADLNWNLQKAWLNGDNITAKVLLYFKRNESLAINLHDELKFYNTLKKYTERKQETGRFIGISLNLQSAVICFQVSVPSAETSYGDVLLWKHTAQTKSAKSEPMCLNDRSLVTRECKPSNIDGAKWLPFNYSLCTKYQPAAQVVCPSEKSNHGGDTLTWPETPIGNIALPIENCKTENGTVLKRKCLGDFITGGFWSQLENVCAGFESVLTMSLRKLAKENITEVNILNSSFSMQDITTRSKNFSITDIQYVARILQNIATVPDIQSEVVRSVVTTVDTVIDVKIVKPDADLLLAVPGEISSALEDILSKVQTNGKVISEAGNSIAVSALPLNTNLSLIPAGGVLEQWGSNVTTLFNDSNKDPSAQLSQFENFEAAVLLPGSLVAQKQIDNVTNIPIIIRKNFYFVKNIAKNVKVISPVIDISIGKKPVYNVTPPVEMVFNIREMTTKYASFKCAFWAADQNLWSFDGCDSKLINLTEMHCFCDHLTSFAIIVDLKIGAETPDFHFEILSIITYIGSCLSIFGLGMIILTFMAFKKWRAQLKHKVLFNLSLALVLFLFLFLTGAEKKHWNYGCMAIAILLHYFLLASFAWMLVEAYLQYLTFVKVVGTYIPRYLQKAMLFAWGFPLVIVGCVLAVDYNSYNNHTTKYCWLTDKVFYYALAGPSLSLLAANFVIFGLILYSNTCGRSRQFLGTNHDEREELIARAKAVFCVSALLGLSWLFGFLAVGESKLIFQYLFTITTTPQGFLIYFFFVYRQKSAREEWVKLLKVSPLSDSSNTGGTGVESTGIRQRKVQNKIAYNAAVPYVSVE